MEQTSNKKPELVELGKRLRELRESNGKSQKEASSDLNIKPSVLSSYEVGDREPSIITLNKISNYYGVTVDYLTGNSSFKKPEHETLHNTLSEIGLKTEAIDKLASISSNERSFLFGKLLMNDNFYDLITLMQYYSTCDNDFEPIEDKSIIKKAVGPTYKDNPLVEFFNKKKLGFYTISKFESLLNNKFPEAEKEMTKKEAEEYLIKMFTREGE